MKKIIFTTLSVLTLLSTDVFSSMYGSSEEPTMESEKEALRLMQVKLYFSGQKYTKTQLKKIAKYFSVSKEREIPIEHSPGGRDFGYDFPKSSPADFMILLAIETSSVKSPICYDLGGGFGGASLNMVLAGGDVTYVEQHPDVAEKARQEVYGALREISVDQEQKKEFWGRLRMVKGDFLNTDHTTLYPDHKKVNFFNLSNVLHFLTPKQLDTFLPALLTKMAPGGAVFASMHVPDKSEKVVDFFLDQKEKGNLYPGYFRYIRHYDVAGVLQVGRAYKFAEVKKLNDAEPAHEGDLPGTKISQTFEPMAPHAPKTMTVKTVIHYFDPDVATAAFKRAGFTVQKAFFTDKFGSPLDDQKSTRELLLASSHHMMIIATKP